MLTTQFMTARSVAVSRFGTSSAWWGSRVRRMVRAVSGPNAMNAGKSAPDSRFCFNCKAGH